MPVLTVLWGIGLLTIAAMSLMWTGNISYQLARNGLEVASINATAEAVINRTILGLIDPRHDKAWRSDGVAQGFVFDGQPINLVIQDELGRIDLNRANTELLTACFGPSTEPGGGEPHQSTRSSTGGTPRPSSTPTEQRNRITVWRAFRTVPATGRFRAWKS